MIKFIKGKWVDIRNKAKYSNRSYELKPEDIHVSRLYVRAKSVGQVKRALKKCTGIKKVRTCTGDGLVEIIHSNQRGNLGQLRDAINKANLIIVYI